MRTFTISPRIAQIYADLPYYFSVGIREIFGGETSQVNFCLKFSHRGIETSGKQAHNENIE